MNQVNGLFMSLLALIMVRLDQIFNVFCLQLHRKNVQESNIGIYV